MTEKDAPSGGPVGGNGGIVCQTAPMSDTQTH